jgi:hypothetical protein
MMASLNTNSKLVRQGNHALIIHFFIFCLIVNNQHYALLPQTMTVSESALLLRYGDLVLLRC